MSADPLAVSPERMREMVDLTSSMLVELLADPRAEPVARELSPAALGRRIDPAAPEQGRPFEELLADLREDVLPFRSRTGAPTYFAFVPGNSTFPGALGDFIASALNVIGDSWMESSGQSQLELVVLDWFKDWLGYPGEAAGVLLSGGSAANMTALACARESLVGPMRDDLVLYASDQSHSSIARAARALGFRPEQLRVLPADEGYRLRIDALEGAMEVDEAAGRRPLAVCAAAGSTNTGAIDPMAEIAELCRRHGAWLHVDAAYGGFAALTDRGRRALAGIDAADSITLDPHKWLYQPYECGCLLVREGGLLPAAFQIAPDYLRDVDAEGQEVNFSDRGFQLTRTSRALKIWLSVGCFGVEGFRRAIDGALDLAASAQALIEQSEGLELLEPARLGIVCFRRRFDGERSDAELDQLNTRVVAALAESGVGMVSSTRLHGRYAIRMCVLNHSTALEDVQRVLGWIEAASVADLGVGAAEPAGPAVARDQTLDQTAQGGEGVSQAPLADIALFEELSDSQRELVAASARLTEVTEGKEVTRRWGGGRDFYVVLAGTVRVELDGEFVRELGPGEFFGELAALDWGAGFGYTRLADVTATTPLRLLVVPPDVLNRLVQEAPGFKRRIEQAVRERLKRA